MEESQNVGVLFKHNYDVNELNYSMPRRMIRLLWELYQISPLKSQDSPHPALNVAREAKMHMAMIDDDLPLIDPNGIKLI